MEESSLLLRLEIHHIDLIVSTIGPKEQIVDPVDGKAVRSMNSVGDQIDLVVVARLH